VNSIEMDHSEVCCKDSGRFELAEHFAQLQALVLVVLNFQAFYPSVSFIISTFEFNQLVF
jgi:hypothetical protein